MNFRQGLASTLGVAFFVGACATTGSNDLTRVMDDDLPEWVEDLPEGTPPEDTEHTEEAMLFLLQAQQFAEGDEARDGFESALESALAGIEAHPENPQSYLQAGEAYLGLSDRAGADSMFNRAEEIYPRYVLETEMHREEAWIESYNLAIEHSQAGDTEEAIRHFEEAHVIYQMRPEAMINLAAAYTEVGRIDDAIDHFREAVDLLDGGIPEYRQPEDEVLEQWAELQEIALFNYAQLLFRSERWEEAATAYEMMRERDPQNLEVMSNLAVALVQSGRDEEATALYDELLGQPDLTPHDLFIIGIGLYQVDAFDEASDAFKQVLERVPEHRDAVFNLAQTLFLGEQFDELEQWSERLVELDPYNRDAYRFLAQALVEQERQQDAVDWLERMEELPFDFEELSLQAIDGGFALVGFLTNHHLDQGTPVQLRVTFFSDEGSEVGTEEVELPAPGQEESAQFQVNLPTEENVFGFRYEVLSP